MFTRRPSRTPVFAGPKALAVLSCALAMLAAQPWQSASASAPTAAAVREIETSRTQPSPALASTPRTNAPIVRATPAVTTRRQLAREEAHAQFHATWIIFQHFLAAQLAPLPHANPLPFDIATFQPVAFTLTPAALLPAFEPDSHRSPPPPCERAYALAHCQLAPPC